MSDPTALPPLPKIAGDIELTLDVYTHNSVRNPLVGMAPGYGDVARLEELGKQVLDLAVTYHLFSLQPMKSRKEIQDTKATILSDENLDQWVTSYGLKEKLRVAPSEALTVTSNPAEMAIFFHVYLGALYIRNGGLPVVQNWISQLISPGVEVSLPNAPMAYDGAHHPQMNQYPQQHQYQQPQQMNHYSPPNHYNNFQQTHSPSMGLGASQLFGTSVNPTPPSHPPPPLPSSPSPYGYSQPQPAATLSLVTLALVNQTAAQKSISVTYPAEQTGPPHQPTWTVRCCMNGHEKGRGVGKSQKVAKEDAARQAWAAMGWGPTA